jgi:hypothetical protein
VNGFRMLQNTNAMNALPRRIVANWSVSRLDSGIQWPNCFAKVATRDLPFINKVTPATSKVIDCLWFQPNLMVWNKPRWWNRPILARKYAEFCQNKKLCWGYQKSQYSLTPTLDKSDGIDRFRWFAINKFWSFIIILGSCLWMRLGMSK